MRNAIAGLIGPPILRLWLRTIRFRWVGDATVPPRPVGRDAMVFAIWHQRLLGFLHTHRRADVRALISLHGDGELLARVIRAFHFVPVRGSTTRGGPEAMREFLREAKSDFDFAITPDGPRGPSGRFQSGAVFLASRSRRRLTLATISYRNAWRLPTWDGFLVPRPFTKAIVRMSGPFEIPSRLSDDELESWRVKLENALQELVDDSDARVDEFWAEGVTVRELYRRFERD